MFRSSSSTRPAGRPVAWATLLACAVVLAAASPSAQAQAAAAPTAAASKSVQKAKVQPKAKSTGSAPGTDCGATAGSKVPSWPKKCPGKGKVPSQP